MPLGLGEYIESLAERRDLIWPRPPVAVSMNATPAAAPLAGLKLVTFSVYGTLLNIDQGCLLHVHPQDLRMQIALDKTIKEFNLWNSMSRKPGHPWEYMLRQYSECITEAGMKATKRKGDVPEIDSRQVWKRLLERLVKNEYTWDAGHYGDLDDLAEKVAYFFHANLQGTAAATGCLETLQQLNSAGIRCGLLADGQAFTLPQLVRDLRQQGTLRSMTDLFAPEFIVLSSQLGVKKPSPTLYQELARQLEHKGIAPDRVLHVSHRLQDDLALARKSGFHTALYAADKNSCLVRGSDLKNPEWRPDRLVADLSGVLRIAGL